MRGDEDRSKNSRVSTMRNYKPTHLSGRGLDCGNLSEGDKRELRLILLADELATLAYREVNWRDVAVLGRAIVALAEAGGVRSANELLSGAFMCDCADHG
jgi:hypothetical protein